MNEPQLGLDQRTEVTACFARVTERDWASVIAADSAQIARRMNADVDRPMSRVAPTDTKVSPIPSSNCFGAIRLA
jgi:hypothetical protein